MLAAEQADALCNQVDANNPNQEAASNQFLDQRRAILLQCLKMCDTNLKEDETDHLWKLLNKVPDKHGRTNKTPII